MTWLSEMLRVQGHSVQCLHNVCGEALYKWIRRSRIVLHINFYANALLATYRLNEGLSHQRVVIAERPSSSADQENVDLYAESGVCFVDPLKLEWSDVRHKLYRPITHLLRHPKTYQDKIRLGQVFAVRHVATFREQMGKVLRAVRETMDAATKDKCL